MTYEELIRHYGDNAAEAARQLELNRQTVHRWKEAGIPDDWQLLIQKHTRGKLRADPQIVAKYRNLLKVA